MTPDRTTRAPRPASRQPPPADYDGGMNGGTVIDDYLAGFSGRHRELMDELAALIRELVPEAKEKIAYGLPTFTLHGNLVHFGASKNHIGFYPGPAGVERFAAELDQLGLKRSKGAIRLPLDEPLPRELITRIVRFRVAQQKPA